MEARSPLIERLNAQGPQATPDRVESILAGLTAAVELPAAESAELDAAVIGTLARAVEVDSLLDAMPVEAVGALLDRAARRCREGGGEAARRDVFRLLDLVRRPSLLQRIPLERRNPWADRLLEAVEASNYTVGHLFRQRAELYGSKVLFQIPEAVGTRVLSWRRTASRVELIARGLLSLEPDGEPGPVAILSDNRIEMALCDLACLTSGIVNVLVPGNATEADVAYILRHAKVRTVLVSTAAQWAKIERVRDQLSDLRHVFAFDRLPAETGVEPLAALIARSEQVPASAVLERAERVTIDDLATVMYTSGTTGTPKGIRFSQRNLVFKRFARAVAIPAIGERDTFLCFLPLFHTFGRFLEMLGCVFWGATYCFLDNPSIEGLMRGMKRHRPSVFISVPKKWLQLHEAIVQRADPVSATDEELAEATREVTGGRLRWGLSAAGHLPSEVFRFFQSQGVELMSGFGMTEATGGITMTPPDRYREDSLGIGLPGIEVMLAEDGELLVRGPYVMIGYLDPPDGDGGFDENGWFHSGDLMQQDADGFLKLIDRKKEIYKNIKGETIAPQRIENLFRDFDSVGRAFLVGDHREYNTLLIWPNPDYPELDLEALSAQEVKDHFRSLVVSVNRFLAPYERIVDFAVIDRDLDLEHGELTPKGSPRRQQVVRNFDEAIRLLYRRTNLHVGGLELTLPNWLLQTLGLTAQDLRVDGDRVVLPGGTSALVVREVAPGKARVGSCLYEHPRGVVNLGALLTSPPLWLGNEDLVDFVALDPAQRFRRGRVHEGIHWLGRAEGAEVEPGLVARLQAARVKGERSLLDLHPAAVALAGGDRAAAFQAVGFLEDLLGGEETPLAEPARLLLGRAADSADADVRRRAFQALVPAERESRFPATLRRFLEADTDLLDDDTRAALCRQNLATGRIDAFVALARELCHAGDASDDDLDRARALLSFLAAYGAGHPASYRRLRGFLVRKGLFSARKPLRKHAMAEVDAIQRGFRRWLGPTSRIAVDPETGREYQWEDVVAFHEDVPDRDRRRILSAVSDTAMLREASFLFSKRVLIRLDDIPPGGIYIRPLGSSHGKNVYRATIQTRFQGGYDLAINVNESLDREDVQEEIRWLILCGGLGNEEPLVEEFGGYWPDQDLWSEEFISGETLARALKRLARRSDESDRLLQTWPFLAWTALSAYVDFWHRCGRRNELADPTLSNVIVPVDDFQTGVRLVSVSARRPHGGLASMMRSFMDEFIGPAVAQYPVLEGRVGWDVVFSSVLEVVGEDAGLDLLREALAAEPAAPGDTLRPALSAYVDTVSVRGFLPRRLFFAAKRYRRWERLGEEATPQARARTLQELYETYGLERLAAEYPETRLRLFRETVLRDGPPALIEGIDELIGSVRRGETVGDELIDRVAELRARLDLADDDDYFLARLSLPYLRPEDTADWVSSDLGGRQQSEIVVNLEDQEGNPFRVRHALNPKEVGRLYQLFLASKLDIRFRPEHRYLVAINDRQQILGGIFYEIEEGGESAHLEKIVVTDSYRRKGVADGLMNELFNRLRAAGVKTLTTGFFRPEYFYAYGFRIEKRYAGLVKNLAEPATASS